MKTAPYVARFYGRLEVIRGHVRSWNRIEGLRCYSKKKSVPLRWSEDEVSLLHELKRQHKSREDILANFPHRTWTAISSKYVRVGERDEVSGRLLYKTGCTPFSSAEARKAMDLRKAGYSNKNIASKLVDRTPQQVANFFYGNVGNVMPKTQSHTRLGKRWTLEETNKLQHLRRDRGLSMTEVACILNRSCPSVTRRAAKCGFMQKRRKVFQEWTADDDATLIRMWDEGASIEEIQRAMPSRTLHSVSDRRIRIRHRLQNDRSFLSRAESEILSSRLRAMRDEGKSWNEIAEILPMHSLSLLHAKLSYKQYGETRRAKQGLRARPRVSEGGDAVKVKEEADVKEKKDSSRKSGAKS